MLNQNKIKQGNYFTQFPENFNSEKALSFQNMTVQHLFLVISVCRSQNLRNNLVGKRASVSVEQIGW